MATYWRGWIIRTTLLLAGLFALFVGPASARDVVLTLTNPKIHGPTGTITFTREDLAALNQAVITTGNDFIDGVAEFKGPLAHEIVEMVGRAGLEHVRLTSLSDFYIEVSISELHKYGAILALQQDGVQLSRRDKGPIWLIYPVDIYPELRDSAYTSRQIWQVRTIELF